MNSDVELQCERCDIPLTERQAVWVDDMPYCGACSEAVWARAENDADSAEECHLEEARDRELDNSQFGVGA